MQVEGALDVGDGGLRVLDDEHAVRFLFAAFDQVEDARQDVAQFDLGRYADIGAGPLQADDGFQRGGHRQAIDIAGDVARLQALQGVQRLRRVGAGLVVGHQHDGQRRLVQGRFVIPAQDVRPETVETQLLDQRGAPRVPGARHDQHVALAYPRVALVVGVVAQALGDDGWRFMALQQLQDGAELLADRCRLFVGNRAQGMVGEQPEGAVLQFLAGAGQPRQVLLVEALGQAVERQRELDELVEVTTAAVTLPAQLKRFRQGDEGMGDFVHESRAAKATIIAA